MKSIPGKNSNLVELVKKKSTDIKKARSAANTKRKRDDKISKELGLKNKGPLRDIKY